MIKTLGLFLIVFGLSVSAETINLTGKVTNKSGKPISGATVMLVNNTLSAKTDATGAFSLVGATYLANPAQLLPSTDKVSFNSGIITVSLTKSSPVKIEMFDLKGNLLERVPNAFFPAGDYQFNLLSHPFASNVMVIRISTNQKTSTYRYLPLQNGRQSFSSTTESHNRSGLAKLQANLDLLKVTATGYLLKETPIASYSTPVTIILDTLNLPPFSFFVTSLKGLQTLSKSEKGFGGDLRFGKTGPGAGLLGADSICQCLAEASMPGSKVKQWRAFLSVNKGPDGTVVNAIDRIGQGPWYDRVGRLLAPSVADLLKDRPANGDKEIKNDLPNENGIPNHQPDPNQDIVDNHLTVTGSNNLGKLFADDATCDDWTSTTSSHTPRAGLSWPRTTMGWGTSKTKSDISAFGGDDGGFQMMNMKSWVSSWSLSGCEAGIDLDESTMAGLPGVKTIGNGGGYGGFYCFALNP